MSEATTEQKSTEAEVEKRGDLADQPLGEGGKKALQAERDRAKELEKQLTAASARLSEMERANETEAQRLQREAQEARDALPKGITEAFREAAVTFGGIDAEDAELFLTSSDKETLQKQAARLVTRTSTTTSNPKPDPSQGAKGTAGARTPADSFAEFFRDLT